MSQHTKLLILLIPLVIMFSFGVDAYVPFVIPIAKQFSVSPGVVQLTLSFYMLALGLGQVFMGLLMDIFGRRIILILSGILFVMTAIVCAYPTAIYALIFFRFLQGIGACGLRVGAFTVVRDHYEGDQAASTLSTLYAAVSLSPMFGPLLGGLVGNYWDWEAVFIFLACLGGICIICSTILTDIYSPPNHSSKMPFSWPEVLSVFTDTRLIFYSLIFGLGVNCLFGFISTITYIIQG